MEELTDDTMGWTDKALP